MFFNHVIISFFTLVLAVQIISTTEVLSQEPKHIVVAIPFRPNLPFDPHWYPEDFADYIANLLPSDRYQVSGYFVSLENIPQFLEDMQKLHAEKTNLCVLNMCEGGEVWDGYPGISLLKLWEKHPVNGTIAKTGADSLFTLNSDDKAKMQCHLRQSNLNALTEILIPPQEPLEAASLLTQLNQAKLSWPLFCKLNIGAGGTAVSDASICHNIDQLLSQLQNMQSQFPTSHIIVQPFLQGSEYTVLVVGDRVYAAVQRDYHNPYNIMYEDYVTGVRPIEEEITYFPAPIQAQLLALQAIRAIPGKHHYTRVDLRSDAKGNIYVIDINDRPGFGTPSTVKDMLEFNHLNESQLLQDILESSTP